MRAHSDRQEPVSIPGGDVARPEPYQPANGIEGAGFMEAFCDRCQRDAAFREGNGDSCPIVANTMVFRVTDDAYPREWIYAADGYPTCTAFEAEVRPLQPGEGT